jgi:hypothetical protein
MPIGPLVPGVPTTVTPDASPTRYTATQGPAPDGPVVTDDVLAVHQIALNVQNWIRDFIPGARTQSFVPVDTSSAVQTSGSTVWTQDNAFGDGSLPPHWIQSTLGSGGETLYIPLANALAYKGKLTAVTVNFTPVNSHVALPATKPVVRLVRVAVGNAMSATIVAEEFDDSPNITIYNTPHLISVGPATAISLPDHSYRYWIAFTGELGTNAINGLAIDSALVWIEE